MARSPSRREALSRAMSERSIMRGWSKGGCVATAVTALSLAGAAHAQAAPNLRVERVANPPASAKEGGAFRVAETVSNPARRGRAGTSDVRFYLARDARS